MRKLNILLSILLIITMCSCEKKSTEPALPTRTADTADKEYSIELSGIGEKPIYVTKQQIKDIAASGKEVIFNESDPILASDSDTPHTAKGVYLDDILSKYAPGLVASTFSSITLTADIGFKVNLLKNEFTGPDDKCEIFIAYEYDGEELSESSQNGALRVLLPGKSLQYWLKKLSKISFSGISSPSGVKKLYFTETLSESLGISGDIISISSLSVKDAYIYICAANRQDSTSIPVIHMYKDQSYYSQCYLNISDAPYIMNSTTGERIDDVICLSYGEATIVSIANSMNANKTKEIRLSVLLKGTGLESSANYSIYDDSGNVKMLSASDIFSETSAIAVKNTDSGYLLVLSPDESMYISHIEVSL